MFEKLIKLLIVWLKNLVAFLECFPLKNRKFYVYKKTGRQPYYIHNSFKSALQEAQRLSEKHFSPIEILEIVKIVVPSEQLISEDEVPF